MLILFFYLPFGALAQIKSSPNIKLTENNIGKTIAQRGESWEINSTYLGQLTDKRGKILFYAVNEFSRIKAARVYHGNSKLIFYNPDKKFYAHYRFSMPNELPFKLKANSFYFNDEEVKPAKISIFKIKGKLPKLLNNSVIISYSMDE